MGRWLLAPLAALSLVACVATTTLWVRSRQRQEMFQYQGRWWLFSVETRWDSMGLIAWWEPSDDPAFVHGVRPPRSGDWAPLLDLCVGLWGGRSLGGGFGYSFTEPCYALIAPTWFAPLATAAPPVSWLADLVARRVRRRRARSALRCVSCGYDLRATPGRCPECGEATQ